MSRSRWLLGVLLSLCLAEGARAGDLDGVTLEREFVAPRVTSQERPFAFVVDPSGPSAGVTTVEYRAGFASGLDAERPIPAELAAAGGSYAFTAAYGLTTPIAPYATASLFDQGNKVNLVLGAHIALTPPTARLRMAVRAARALPARAGDELLGAGRSDPLARNDCRSGRSPGLPTHRWRQR